MFRKTTIGLCSALLLSTTATGAFAHFCGRGWGGHGGGPFARFEQGYGRGYRHYGFGRFAYGYGRGYRRHGFGYDQARIESQGYLATSPDADDPPPASFGAFAHGGGQGWGGHGSGGFSRFEHAHGQGYGRDGFGYHQARTESPKTPATPPSADNVAPAPVAATPSTGKEANNGIVNDETLRPGDAYMAPDGLRVFMGARHGVRSIDDFVSVAKARNMNTTLRAQFLAYTDGAAKLNPPSAYGATIPAAPPSESQPSASRSNERIITDSQGKNIRFVGGAPPQF